MCRQRVRKPLKKREMSCKKVQKSERRVRKLLKRKDESEKRDWRKRVPTPPPGLLHECEKKGDAGIGFCMSVKIRQMRE